MNSTQSIDKQVKQEQMTEEEAAAAFGDLEDVPGQIKEALENPAAAADADVPDWVTLPPGFTFPPGKKIGFMRFRGEWTDAPAKGDRVIVVWSLTEAEEKLAYKRAAGDSMRGFTELAKQTIRVIDGHKTDWTGASSPGSIHFLWNDLGTRCRQLVQNYYLKAHTLTSEQQQDFFANCFAVRSAVVG